MTEQDTVLAGGERPWRRPGASLDDFFNYGFNEHSWKEYASKQIALKLKLLKGLSNEEVQNQVQSQAQGVSAMYERD